MKIFKKVTVIVVLLAWLLSGWPLKIPEVQAATALTTYLTSTNTTTTLSASARQLTNSAPSSETTASTKVARTTKYCELFSRGTTSACSGVASAPNPSGNGFVWDVTTLEAQQFLAGNWTGAIKLKTGVASGITVTAYMRAYKYSGSAYTLIATSTSNSIALTSTAQALTFSAGAGSLTTFTTGDKLYIDFIVNITTNTANSGSATIILQENGGAVEQMVTPGYQPQPPTVTTQATSNITATTATGNGNITSIGGTSVTTWGVCYKISSGCTTADSTSAGSGSGGTGAFTASITGLGANTTYYINAYATNPTATSYGSEVTALTTPGAPGTPTFTNIKDATLTVNWTAPTNGASSYKIERCSGSGCSNFAEIRTGETGIFYNDSGLTGNTLYRYRVRATNTTGDGTYSGIGEITTGIVSISITSNGTVSYGIVPANNSKNTTASGLNNSQTAQNNGNLAEDFNIKTSNATGGTPWTLGSTTGADIFVHEFSTNGGGAWTTFITAGSYQSLVTNIAATNSQTFDLRLTTPTSSSDYQQKTITVTIQAVAH